MARAGGRGGAHRFSAPSGVGPQAPAVPLPGRPAQEAPDLELPALVHALAEALGPRGLPVLQLLRETLLLLLPRVLPPLLPPLLPAVLPVLPLQQVLPGAGGGAGHPRQGPRGL